MRKQALSAAIAAIVGLTSVAARDTVAAETVNEPRNTNLEEVVVSAQRREERLQDVPISISVLSGEHLDTSTSSGVLEELTKVPSVAMLPQPEGRSIMVIRGAAPQAGVSPVGYYFDMVPISFLSGSLAPDADGYDLKRVEVLKGPQGTGYGLGSSSGVVRVLTNDPDASRFDAKGRVSMSSTQGGGTNYRADAAINAPLVDGRLAIRGVVGLENWGGWVDRPNKQDANDSDGTNVRLKIGGDIVEGLNVVAGIWHTKNRGAPVAADDNGKRNVYYDEHTNALNDIYSLVVRKDFGAFSLVSSTSYADISADYFKRSIFTTVGNVIINDWHARASSEEINLTSNGSGPWKWTAGLFYRSIDEHYGYKLASLANINTAPLAVDDYLSADSYSAFGELSYSFAQFELLGGLRYSKEDRRTYTGLPGIDYDEEASFNKATPRVVLSWKPSADAMTYVSYAEGFRSGLIQFRTAIPMGFGPVKSDLLRNYELGNKATLFDGLLSWEAAVYYMDWKDVQQGLVFPVTVAGQITFLDGVANTSSASGVGGEVSLTFRPVDGFQIGASYSQNNLQIDSDVSSGGVVLFRKGDRLAMSPKTTYGAFAEYSAPIGADLELQIGANMSHVSSQIQRFLIDGVTDINNDPATVVSLNVGLGRNDGSRRLSLFVDNLTDENAATGNNYSSSNPPVGNPDEGLRLRPRTVGLQVEMKF